MAESSSKLSFSLPSSKQNPKKRPSSSSTNFNFEQTDSTHSQNHSQFVTEFDPSKTLTDSNHSTQIIPRLENTWNPYKKMKNIDIAMRGSASDDPDLRFEIEAPNLIDASDSSMAYGLNVRDSIVKKENSDLSLQVQVRSNTTENVILQKFKDDMKNLPDDLGMDEFTDVPVEGYGAALLKGYGWSEGMGIGKNVKEDVKVVQYVRRGDKEGLGFEPDMPTMKKGRKHDPNSKGDVVGKVDEKKGVQKEMKGVRVGKVVRIVSGRHIGLKGKVLEKSSGESSSKVKVVLKLSNDEKVSVGIEEVAELGTVDDELCVDEMKSRRLKDAKDERKKVERRERERESHRESERKSGGRDDRKKDRRGNREEERGLNNTKYSNGSAYRSNDREYGSKEVAKSTTITWLRNHIRVRIISKDFKGGKLYLKKGVVVDVVGPNICDISLDATNQLIQGVNQDILETAIPKRGGPVLVLYGKHKGVFGHLVERNNESETGVVRDADNLDLLNVQLEQIAEYMGDPSSLGY